MKTVTIEDLQKRNGHPSPAGSWIRVGMDTGGIAAGAKRLYELFQQDAKSFGFDGDVLRTGSYGYSYIDPLVEVCTGQGPPTLYGMVDEAVAAEILELHLQKGRLVPNHIVASRIRGSRIGEEPTVAILVKDTSCESGDKTDLIVEALRNELSTRGLSDDTLQVVPALDMGIYDEGVVLQFLPSLVTYTNVLSKDISRVVDYTLRQGRILVDLFHGKADRQKRIVLRNCGILDPESLEDALDHGAYGSLASVLKDQAPERILTELKTSGLRGRGGAGFPTWLKWKLTRESAGERKFVICNADEGDPGAFMDRSVLEGDPHAVLEGLMLAGYAIGAEKGYFYIRAEYPLAVSRVELAIREARESGLLGRDILGSGWSFDVEVRLGAGAFVCGEETALIASVEGKRGSPHPRPPFPSVKGLWECPTCINNVETLAAVPAIIREGGSWYAGMGTESSRGTKVFAVTGKVKNPQLVEVPMGTTVREIVYGICGGVQDDIPIKGVQTGGPSGGIIPEEFLDTAVSYESLQALGSIMGSGGMLVMDENDCMVDVAVFYLKFCVDESCGKCAPCRVGGFQMLRLLEKIAKGRGAASDLEQVDRICQAMRKGSLCGLGQTAPNPILSTLKYFKEEYNAFIEGGTSYARKRRKAQAEGTSLKAS